MDIDTFNHRTNRTYRSFREAVAEAQPGDVLTQTQWRLNRAEEWEDEWNRDYMIAFDGVPVEIDLADKVKAEREMEVAA